MTIALIAASCGGSDGASEVPEPPAVDVVVRRAADAMAELETARFEMERSGAPVRVSGIVFDSALGVYEGPDAAKAVLGGQAGDLAVELGTISIGPRTWLTNPLTGAWEELEPGTGFNPAVIFDAEVGWRAILLSLIEPTYEGGADHGGEGLWLVSGTIPPERIATLTMGLVEPQPVEVDLFVDPGTDLLRRVEFTTEGEDGGSDWVITLSEFDEPVTIDPPAGG
jgi:lipoprotein LprG